MSAIDPQREPVPTLDFFANHEHNYVHGIANTSRVMFNRVSVALRSGVGLHANVDTIVWLSAWCELAITTEPVPHDDLTETNGVAALLVDLKRTHPDLALTVHLGLDDTIAIPERGLDPFAKAAIEDFFDKRDRPPWADGPDRRRGWPL